MKQKFFLSSVLVFGACFAVFFAFIVFQKLKSNHEPSRPSVSIGGAVFSVEVVRTAEEQARGLGYRDSLCADCGMLFPFERPDRYSFWMKGMRFPIDIIWIREGTIVHIERNASHTDQTRVYRPDAPADMVLELGAGICNEKGIRENDRVIFSNVETKTEY